MEISQCFIALPYNSIHVSPWVGLCHRTVYMFSLSLTLTQVKRQLPRLSTMHIHDAILLRFMWSTSSSITIYLKPWTLLIQGSVRCVFPNHLSQFILKNNTRESISNFSYRSTMLTLSVIQNVGVLCIIAHSFLSSVNRSSFFRAQTLTSMKENASNVGSKDFSQIS